MNRDKLKEKLSTLSLSMFRKDFFGIYHGSISAKTESNRFIINTKEAVFDALNKDNLIELYFKKKIIDGIKQVSMLKFILIFTPR